LSLVSCISIINLINFKEETYMKIMKTRRAAILSAVTLALGVASGQVLAQAWPNKTVSIIVPFGPGGTTDVLARAVANDLSKALGQSVIVEYKPGAGATIGAEFVAKAKPDGYTILMGAVHHTIATSTYKNLRYDFQKDLAPITTVALVPNVLVVNPNVPAKNVKELIALAKAEPNKYSYGSNGTGTGQHLIGAIFESMAAVQMLHVPYKGSAQLTTDLLGGQVPMSFDTITPVLQNVKSGKLRALAVTTAKRSSALPDVPSMDESGLKGFNMGTWFGMLAPAGTPAEIITKLNAEVVKILNVPEFRKKLEDLGAQPIADTPEQMARLIKDDTERYAKVVRDNKIDLN
jgi:tripartite-type tricarboxylate transporter receptor subunit TctC